MPYKDKEKRAEYQERMCRMVSIRLMRDSDADLVEWVERQEHPSREIKRILKEAIKDGRC